MNGDESTRARMVGAAVQCIVDEGYYRASSNRIAERAGVTWGVIQYHFGTREQLLLAVVRDGAEDLLQAFSSAEITGDTVEARLDSLTSAVWAHYRRPEFVAYLQVLLNLGKDPRTSADTVEAMADTERQMGGLWQKLVDQVVPGRDQRPGLGLVIFDLIRGTAIGDALLDALPRSGRRTAGSSDATREGLVRALTLLVAAG